jgi:hypothetical protein
VRHTVVMVSDACSSATMRAGLSCCCMAHISAQSAADAKRVASTLQLSIAHASHDSKHSCKSTICAARHFRQNDTHLTTAFTTFSSAMYGIRPSRSCRFKASIMAWKWLVAACSIKSACCDTTSVWFVARSLSLCEAFWQCLVMVCT